MPETLIEILKPVSGVIFGGGITIFWKWVQKKKRMSAELIAATANAEKTKAEAEQIKERTRFDVSEKAGEIAKGIIELLKMHNDELHDEILENRKIMIGLRQSLDECERHRIEDEIRFRKLELKIT